ncbi:hypothetical protein Acor_72440 [Acrocarpospora corrugata]|uniref:Pentapeptide repeat-containing protein n=1 Tax=Acrocarpospora corrugata TaxID=35763 RepID=A0A5M3W8M1_9ACTN|nr:pentapeptide repeat-containing protein [Acrocarpospora corrugata]GES05176.1 hypothetical protein Acor_72440 [Acrocarpospora corrugata]
MHTITALTTSVGVLLGVAFTAFGLIYTARTLAATQEAQITDRYTKAVEQLDSSAVDVRLGAIYALQRIATDSAPDRPTIQKLLAAFVRNHDLCTPQPPPPQCATEPPSKPDATQYMRLPTDVYAALTIAPALTTATPATKPQDHADFSQTRFPHADLFRANLSSANLNSTDLTGANLANADLTDVDLANADLTDVFLTDANLTRADLSGANLTRADLYAADLTGVDLSGADLTGANLTDADLTGADLSSAILTNALLSGANLTNVRGMTPDEIREATRPVTNPTIR